MLCVTLLDDVASGEGREGARSAPHADGGAVLAHKQPHNLEVAAAGRHVQCCAIVLVRVVGVQLPRLQHGMHLGHIVVCRRL